MVVPPFVERDYYDLFDSVISCRREISSPIFYMIFFQCLVNPQLALAANIVLGGDCYGFLFWAFFIVVLVRVDKIGV